MDKYYLQFEIPGLPKCHANSRFHHHAKAEEIRYWRQAVVLAVGHRAPKTPLEKAKITYKRFGSLFLDGDNLANSFKAVQDGLVDAGVLADDRWLNIGMPTYEQEKVRRGDGKIKITVEGD